MKKIIVIIAIIVVCVNLTFAQAVETTKERVRIETSGFDNNDIALLQITQYARKKPEVPANWQLVESDPQSILEVSVYTEQMKSWEEIDYKAVRYNALLRRGNEVAEASINRIGGNNRVMDIVRESGKGLLRTNIESRLKPERHNLEKWRATVRMTLRDAKTGHVYSKSIGYSTITVRVIRDYGHEPLVLLDSGDLTIVGIAQGENLDGQMRFLLQLSAFMKSDLPVNQITD